MSFFISTFFFAFIVHVHFRDCLKCERTRKVKFKSENGGFGCWKLARSISKKIGIDEDAHCPIRFFQECVSVVK